MPYCPNCAHEIPADAAKCPACPAVFGPQSAWQPVESRDAAIAAAGNGDGGMGFAALCMKATGYMLVMFLGGLYGIFAYGLFDKGFSREGASGLMLTSFVVGVPIAIGTLVAYLAARRPQAGVAGPSALASLSIALFVFAAGAVFREGIICIIMASPLFIGFALFGALLGVIASAMGSHGPKLLSVALVAPVVGAPAELAMTGATDRQVIMTSIYIDAKPATVWHHINYRVDIRPAELSGGVAYRMGVPYPIEARTLEERVGGRRALRWERGVSFEEEITVWEPERRIAWVYRFRPDSFPPGSLDDHIVIGGRYFNLENTSYTLTTEGQGTRLTLTVGTRVSTNFNWYAGLWARFLVADTARVILQFYKARSEAI